MVSVQRKSQLVTELEEAYLSAEHYQDIDRVPVSTCVVADFMSFQRSAVIPKGFNKSRLRKACELPTVENVVKLSKHIVAYRM